MGKLSPHNIDISAQANSDDSIRGWRWLFIVEGTATIVSSLTTH
jgi:hypothetical protein